MKRILLWTSGALFLLISVLMLHIYSVTRKHTSAPTIQLVRIDFTQKPEAGQAAQIEYHAKQLPGVQSTYFNIADGILILTVDLAKNTPNSLSSNILSFSKLSGKRYTVTASQAASGCPAGMSNSSTMGKLGKYLSTWFK